MKTKMQKQQELVNKRAKEKKETTSIRLSSSERAVAEKKAVEKGMKLSAYIGYAAVHIRNIRAIIYSPARHQSEKRSK